mmetsp:Transcript_4991/g.20458  ORF Transcript_4991/g.20458 Transcript_4991/m.20458 type:complete len:549 (+) Transcript_4991:336-1982(+)
MHRGEQDSSVPFSDGGVGDGSVLRAVRRERAASRRRAVGVVVVRPSLDAVGDGRLARGGGRLGVVVSLRVRDELGVLFVRREGPVAEDLDDVVVVDRLFLDEELRQLRELVLLRREQLDRPFVRRVDDRLGLLVHRLRRRVRVRSLGPAERGGRFVALRERELADARVHAVDLDHRVDHLRDAPQVVRGARRDRAEGDLLGRAPAERHADDVDDLVLGAQRDLLGEVLREAEGARAARDDGHLEQRVGMLEEPPRDRVAGLVERDDLLLFVGHDLVGFEPADDAVDRGFEVLHVDLGLVAPRRHDRRFVAHVLDLGPREARREPGEPRRKVLDGPVEVDAAEVHQKDLLAADDVGSVDGDLPVEAPRSRQRLVEDVDAVGPRQHDDVRRFGEAVHLDEQLIERIFALVVAAGEAAAAALAADGVDLVDEHDGRRQVVGDTEQLAHELGPVAEIFLDELRADDAEEGRRRLVRDGFREEGFPRAGDAVEDDAFGWLDADFLVELGVLERQFDGFFDFLDLRLEAPDVGVRLERRLLDFHHRDHRVGVVR